MDGYLESEDRRKELQIEHERRQAYVAACPTMNRAERRTARGRMLVALGEAAALRAEVEFLRNELERHRS